MDIQGSLRGIEQAFGFSYPPSFVFGVDALVALVGFEGFRRGFGDAKLLLSEAEIVAAHAVVPDGLVPFMSQDQVSLTDIYAFEARGEAAECRVVVWADHAVVMDWENFPAFMQWLREQLE